MKSFLRYFILKFSFLFRNKHLILSIKHNAGFFSCSTVALRNVLDFYNQFGFFPILNRLEQYKLYKDHFWNNEFDFFKYSRKAKLMQLEYASFFKTNTNIEDQFSDYRNINFEHLSSFVNEYFIPNDEVKKKVQFLKLKYKIEPQNTIAVYYRGTDKAKETTLPDFETYYQKIISIQEQNPRCELLIQTDQLDLIESFEKKLSFKAINENYSSNKYQEGIHYHLLKGNRVLAAQWFLATVVLMSECKLLIMNSCNVSLWICLYRGSNNGVSQFISNGLKSNLETYTQGVGWCN